MNDMNPTNEELVFHLKRAVSALDSTRTKLKELEYKKNEPIAVVGMSCRFPGGANSPDLYWDLLRDGVDAVTQVPASRWDIDSLYDPDRQAPGKMYCRYGAFLSEPVDLFDPQFFGISPREAELMDPQQRLLLEVTWEALEHAAIPAHHLRGTQTGVFVGIGSNDYGSLLNKYSELKDINAYYGTGNAISVAAGRLAYLFGFEGPCFAIDTACSSALVAIHNAVLSLRSGESDTAIAGGVNLILAPELTINFCKANMLAADGQCKTFDATADGYVRGEGCGMLILKRLSDAEKEGDRILAIIRGSAINQDGASGGLTVPNSAAQTKLMHAALANANCQANDITYIEAHGTGTKLGDPIEISAIAKVYGQQRELNNILQIGSVKTNIGHLEATAGVAGLIKIILALQHNAIPPNLHLEKINPRINLASIPASIPVELNAWPRVEKIRRAGISSFGFSGTNAHVIIEEAPVKKIMSVRQDRDQHVITLSAMTAIALEQTVENFIEYLKIQKPSRARQQASQHYLDDITLADARGSVGDIAYTANAGRTHFSYRLAVVVSTVDALITKLKEKDFLVVHVNPDEDCNFDLESDEELPCIHADIIAQHYLIGADIDWLAFDAPYHRSKVFLPTYPFQRDRYWALPKQLHLANKKNHPLLGEVLLSPLSHFSFSQSLDVSKLDYLLDHKFLNQIIFPASGFVELILASAKQVLTEPFLIENLIFKVPLRLSVDKPTFVQVTVDKQENNYSVAIHSLLNAENNTWQNHCLAELNVNSVLDNNFNKFQLSEAEPMIDVYQHQALANTQYGKKFQSIQRLWLEENSGIAELKLDLNIEEYICHPALLDGCFQLLGIAVLNKIHPKLSEIYLPASVKTIQLFKPITKHAYAHILLNHEINNSDITADLSVYNDEDELLVVMQGMTLKVASHQFFQTMPISLMLGNAQDFILELEKIKPDERLDFIKDYLHRKLQDILKLKSDMLDDNKGFFETGMDSLMAIELHNQLQQALGAQVRLPATLIFDYPTINALSSYILKTLYPLGIVKAIVETDEIEKKFFAMSEEELLHQVDLFET